MALPKRRHSRARVRQKRAHWKLAMPTVVACPKCEAPILPHTLCRKCGSYNGRQVLKVRERKGKKSDRRR
ncbi:MAG: 50S ribosomal protein L32 [Candidatus Zipacnadales bacterium]